jgi:hypothetical protein
MMAMSQVWLHHLLRIVLRYAPSGQRLHKRSQRVPLEIGKILRLQRLASLDTSAMPDDTTITSAKLWFAAQAVSDNADNCNFWGCGRCGDATVGFGQLLYLRLPALIIPEGGVQHV